MDFLKWFAGIVAGLITACLGEEYLRFRPGLPEKYVLKIDYQREIDKLQESIRDLHMDIKKDLLRIYDKIEETRKEK